MDSAASGSGAAGIAAAAGICAACCWNCLAYKLVETNMADKGMDYVTIITLRRDTEIITIKRNHELGSFAE